MLGPLTLTINHVALGAWLTKGLRNAANCRQLVVGGLDPPQGQPEGGRGVFSLLEVIPWPRAGQGAVLPGFSKPPFILNNPSRQNLVSDISARGLESGPQFLKNMGGQRFL